MSATLNLYSLALAYDDAAASNDPVLKYVDWKRSIQGIYVHVPKSEGVTIPPLTEKLIFDGTRALTLDGTTAFNLTLSPLVATTYRLTHASGTNPGFRTDRALNLAAIALTLVVQTNGSLTMTAGSGTPFATVQVGDEIFIPGTSTGDAAGPFKADNEGRWVVLTATSTVLTLVRPSGEDFKGIGEVVTPASAAQVLGFTASGVQASDKLDISAGFATTAQRTYDITAVTSKWVEFTSTTALGAQSAIAPGATGIAIYTGVKRFLRIEADQDCAVRINGDTSQNVRLEPWVAGDKAQVAEFTKVGPTWVLKVYNRSAQTLNLLVISAE